MRLLTRWIAGNKRLPRQILFFRDGVSEGQFGQVRLGSRLVGYLSVPLFQTQRHAFFSMRAAQYRTFLFSLAS